MKSKYDSYGVLYSIQHEDITAGSVVEYIDAKSAKQKTKKTTLVGVWDGSKVCFDDKEKTVVRTTRWLKVRVSDKIIDNNFWKNLLLRFRNHMTSYRETYETFRKKKRFS